MLRECSSRIRHSHRRGPNRLRRQFPCTSGSAAVGVSGPPTDPAVPVRPWSTRRACAWSRPAGITGGMQAQRRSHHVGRRPRQRPLNKPSANRYDATATRLAPARRALSTGRRAPTGSRSRPARRGEARATRLPTSLSCTASRLRPPPRFAHAGGGYLRRRGSPDRRIAGPPRATRSSMSARANSDRSARGGRVTVTAGCPGGGDVPRHVAPDAVPTRHQCGHKHGRLVAHRPQHLVRCRTENVDERRPHSFVQRAGDGRREITDHLDAVWISGSHAPRATWSCQYSESASSGM